MNCNVNLLRCITTIIPKNSHVIRSALCYGNVIGRISIAPNYACRTLCIRYGKFNISAIAELKCPTGRNFGFWIGFGFNDNRFRNSLTPVRVSGCNRINSCFGNRDGLPRLSITPQIRRCNLAIRKRGCKLHGFSFTKFCLACRCNRRYWIGVYCNGNWIRCIVTSIGIYDSHFVSSCFCSVKCLLISDNITVLIFPNVGVPNSVSNQNSVFSITNIIATRLVLNSRFWSLIHRYFSRSRNSFAKTIGNRNSSLPSIVNCDGSWRFTTTPSIRISFSIWSFGSGKPNGLVFTKRKRPISYWSCDFSRRKINNN